MNIEILLSEDDRSRLSLALGAAVDVERIAEIVARAGVREAIDYATGVAVFSSMSELRSYRVACLLGAGMEIVEAEVLVASLFKVPLSTARRYVETSLARYRVDLGEHVGAATRAALEAGAWDEDSARWLVSLPMSAVRQRVTDLLSQQDLPDPKTAERGALFMFPDDTYRWLRAAHDLPPAGPRE